MNGPQQYTSRENQEVPFVEGGNTSDRLTWLQHSINQISEKSTHACTSIDLMKSDIDRMRPDIDNISTIKASVGRMDTDVSHIPTLVTKMNIVFGIGAFCIVTLISAGVWFNSQLTELNKSYSAVEYQTKSMSSKLTSLEGSISKDKEETIKLLNKIAEQTK
ncbi:hypothetical protein [Vibrio splendidus]|uniref:hypothetical protein n=1 Tax=Vibrio splendidus TaxID=29497 RepID=UPI000C82A079|nr:hypothetical protein [Vibrio splendidus]PMN25934.1 hypothetical protein BCT36_11310 [Vibrio splendidus]